MSSVSTGTLTLLLVCLVIISGFFSGSETGMMSLNRYRLRHMMRGGNKAAHRVDKLLRRPDRLLGLILIGNNFVNILAAAIASIIAVRLLGDIGVMVSTVLLTLIVLVFAEVTPKTLAALHPERIAFPAALLLTPLLKLLYPAVVVVNWISNKILRLFGVNPDVRTPDGLNSDELRSVVHEAGSLISSRHQTMLLSILDMERMTVEDIMVPRNEIIGLDLNGSQEEVLTLLASSTHTRLPVYEDSVDNVVGVLHVRDALQMISAEVINKETLKKNLQETYFIPEGTPLNTQLLNFQKKKRHIGLVVDEYGDIQGLVTIVDILEEIVGEFNVGASSISREILAQKEGGFLVDGGTTIRDLNRQMSMHLPTDGPKTLSGLIVDYLQAIPEAGTGLRLAGYPIEILQVKDNMVKTAKIMVELYHTDEDL